MSESLRVELNPDLEGGLKERLISIWTDVSNAGGAVGFVPTVSIQDVTPVAEEAFARTTGGRDDLVVALEANEPIGFCFLEKRPGPLFTHWATIKRLQVHPDLQGKGYGTRILDQIHELARDRLGLEQIHLTVRGGTGTEAFYVGHGYEIVARIPGMIRVAPDDDREEIYLIKTLI